MTLEERCEKEFLSQDRFRGELYFQQGRVDLEPLNGAQAQAAVLGSKREPYQVKVDAAAGGEGRVWVACECPRFADGLACKHVWATLLAVDQLDPAWMPGEEPLSLVLEPPDTGDEAGEPPLQGPATRATEPRSGAVEPRWRRQMRFLREAVDERLEGAAGTSGSADAVAREAWFALDLPSSKESGELVVDLYQRERRKSGDWGKIKRLRLDLAEVATFPYAEDRELLRLLIEAASSYCAQAESRSAFGWQPTFSSAAVPSVLYETVLPRLCDTGRFLLSTGGSPPDEGEALAWEGGPPLRLRLDLAPTGDADDEVEITGYLVREGERRPVSEPLLVLGKGVVVFRRSLAALAAPEEFPWIAQLRSEGPLTVAAEAREELLAELWSFSRLPELVMPAPWRPEEVQEAPQPRLALRPLDRRRARGLLDAEVWFHYGDQSVRADDARGALLDPRRRQVFLRDRDAELAALGRLAELGFRPPTAAEPAQGERVLAETDLAAAVESLAAEGWRLEASGRRLRRPGGFSLNLKSGIDWFDLEGEMVFGDQRVGLPRLLKALRRGESFVRLDDGSEGLLPADWLARFARLANLAPEAPPAGDELEADEAVLEPELEGEVVRFLPSQALLLDALLAAEPEVEVDERFVELRSRLRSFEQVEAAPAPDGFFGRLRGYQRQGLGWLYFLRDFGFGGCLADDMGLGKTVQVLALLADQRRRAEESGEHRPSLIVVPRSLLHNWLDEAARFTPALRLATYHGPDRAELRSRIGDYDAVVTTYGTLRRDALYLRSLELEYVILDEAQAVKNPESQAAKACRLLRGNHRLALTGTPVENHLGELWSIFEFLNPGMLGRLPALEGLAGARTLSAGDLAALSQALRPFILRRTKEQVLADLPAKTEQTLYCELSRREQKLYDELREHYRSNLMQRIAEVGLAKSKIQVLEALLRLRQAACHPGLLDPERAEEGSAKLETLVEQVEEVLDEGHKALVFSQFTSLLAIVRRRFDRLEVPYEYLDGRTRDRKERVERFQRDDDCRLFLISLKAGGLGLNLTAADYVFLLDPWWNPAVEAQAVDRTHRIGQTRPVFAYRLISRGTVEEKILELQQSKRELAEALLEPGESLLRTLTAEDLQQLLD